MLLVGIDWAEAQHAARLLAPDGAIVRRLPVPHSPAGFRRLPAVIAEAEPDSSAVLVALEHPDGLLVDALLAANYTVYALNPKAVERYRGRTRTAGEKIDPAEFLQWRFAPPTLTPNVVAAFMMTDDRLFGRGLP